MGHADADSRDLPGFTFKAFNSFAMYDAARPNPSVKVARPSNSSDEMAVIWWRPVRLVFMV